MKISIAEAERLAEGIVTATSTYVEGMMVHPTATAASSPAVQVVLNEVDNLFGRWSGPDGELAECQAHGTFLAQLLLTFAHAAIDLDQLHAAQLASSESAEAVPNPGAPAPSPG